MERIIRAINAVSTSLAVMALFANVCVVMYGVITRYLLGGAPMWTDELARFLMIAAAFLGSAVVWSRGEHMRVSLAERLLSGRALQLLLWYQWLLGLAIAAVGVYLTLRYAMSVSMFRSQALGISRSIPVLAMPAGLCLLGLLMLCRGPKPLPQLRGY